MDPVTLDLVERFEVDDHITWLVPAADEDALYGASWGSRRLYRWGLSEDADGQLSAGHPEAWENPSWHLDFQEAQYDGGGRLICAGISELPDPDGGKYELGGVAVVHFGERRLVADVPVPLFSAAGHTVFRNPFLLTRDRSEVLLHVAPDDGDELNGTEILTYRVRHESGPPSRSGRLRTFARCGPAAQ
jgi:hypothetical protein